MRENEYDLKGIVFEEMLELHKENGVYLEYSLKEGSKLTGCFLKTDTIPSLITKENLLLYRPLTRKDRRIWSDHRKKKKKFGFGKRN